MNIKQYLMENEYVLTDGAMGTYYSQISSKKTTFSELANIEEPDIIKRIHLEYIEAGAKLIRTNTFSINRLNMKKYKIEEIIRAAVNIAKEACKKKSVYIAGSIGPIFSSDLKSDEILKEYKTIIDQLLINGINIFLFETFSSLDFLPELSAYIKHLNKNNTVIVQFSIMTNGQTRSGLKAEEIFDTLDKDENIDIFGFNCGTGPMHLYNNIRKFNLENKFISIIPNSGFPEIINGRTVYRHNPEYFAKLLIKIKELGVKMIGGCCGTSPEHIKKLNDLLKESKNNFDKKIEYIKKEEVFVENKNDNLFINKLKSGEFTIAVELDPPFSTDITKLMEAAKVLSNCNVDAITISDSPIGKVRVSSVLIASKIKRELGIEVIPHICCRDRNIIGLKSDLIGAHIENIRNVLIVTGDPIPSAERNEIKSVFNLNSIGLMGLTSKMNEDLFQSSPYSIGGALNLNVMRKENEIKRMYKKIDNGSEFFLTQPIYDDETIEFLINIKKEKNFKILAGIMPLISYRNALFLNNEIPGIDIPNKYIERFNEDMDREEAQKTGIEIAMEIANKLKEHVDGFYFITPFNRASIIKELLDKLGLNKD